MFIQLKGEFTDVKINGKLDYSPFLPGDIIDVISITQLCTDLGCCEVEYTIQTDEWNDGKPFTAYKYFRNEEIPNWDEWQAVLDKDLLIMTYYPPSA